MDREDKIGFVQGYTGIVILTMIYIASVYYSFSFYDLSLRVMDVIALYYLFILEYVLWRGKTTFWMKW